MNAFRQVCDKPCAHSIIQTEWSPCHDLVAVITVNGDVRLHRMQWQKVWVLSSKESPATCCSWKNNGKLLAVGHENGKVTIIEIEKATTLHTLNLSGKITSLKWSSFEANKDSSKLFESALPKELLPEVKRDELVKNLNNSQVMISDEEQQCYLTIGTNDGDLQVYLDGIFLILKVTADKYPVAFTEHSISTTNACLETGSLAVLSKSVKGEEGDHVPCYFLHQFESQELRKNTQELFLLSQMYTKLCFLVQRCQRVLKQLADSSEDISLKINSKLEKLERLVADGDSSVAAEFTIAYATGETSPELETFLTQNLTTKGLKQIEQNVQLAYASMHSDVTEEMELIIQHMMVYLSQLYGMSRWTEKYECLGLSEKAILRCFETLGKFAMRVLKLLKVICSDMGEFSIFFTWLTCLCFHVSGESQPTFPELSFKEYDIMIDFLENRLVKNSSGSYNLERVSQFFNKENSNMQQTKEKSELPEPTNDWFEYVRNTDCLKDNPLILIPDDNSTLQCQFESFQESFKDLFESISISLTNSLQLVKSTKLFAVADNHEEDCAPVFSFMRKDGISMMTLLACSCDSDRMFVVNLDISSKSLEISGISIEPSLDETKDESMVGDDDQLQYTIKHSLFYNNDFITVIYDQGVPEGDQITSILGQLPFEDSIDKLDFLNIPCSLEEGILDQENDISWLNVLEKFSEQRSLENFRATSVCVNAKRSVSCIVSCSRRRIRVFDMESGEEEIDESKMNDSNLDATEN